MELQEIIKKLKFICSQEGLSVSPESILDNSVKIYNTMQIDKSKKENMNIYQNKEKVSQKPQESELKPSEKQINLLKKLKLKIPNTKNEATILIRENIERNKNKYRES